MKISRRVNFLRQPDARARRASTGRAACELWGLCARPPAIEIGEGGLVSLAPARLGRVSSYDLLKSAAALTFFVTLTRARGAPPRVEPPVSYGASARGRPRSRLARGAWSRSLQARLGRVSSYDLLKSAAALTFFVRLTRARGAPPRGGPPVSYGAPARGAPRSRLARGAWSRSLQARLGRVSSYDLLKSAAALTFSVSLTRARGAARRVGHA